jgi:prolyl 4-hydroxylase
MGNKADINNSETNGAKDVTATEKSIQDTVIGPNKRNSSSYGRTGPSIVVALFVAVMAFGAGMLTPPLWLQLQRRGTNKTASSFSTTDATAQQQQRETVEFSDDMKQKYPCTEERLAEFFHETYVPGFHILCLDVDDSKLILKYYKGGMQSKSSQISLDLPVSWPSLKLLLTDSLELTQADDMHQPFALFTPQGGHIIDELTQEVDVGWFASSMASKFGMVLLYQGGQFLWPGVRVGFERQVSLYSIMPPNSPEYPDKNATVTLETLSLAPLVLSVKGFLSAEECQHIQQTAAPTMRYSDVVLMDHDAGRPASDFRTSQTTFLNADDDEILVDLDYRTASLVRIPRSHQEPIQVLRYGNTERYTSHHDYFDPRLYQKDKKTLRLIGNGRRNRMVTVFWYLSDVEQGGETIFPRSGGGRERSFDDCETGLKVKPESGKVIIFYSMTFEGKTDSNSLHGACRVVEGIKWAANKWVWNEAMRYVPA